jgi:pimeloyl-ACP methyl ester carboxylesterase
MNFREIDVSIQSKVVIKGTLSIPESGVEKGPAVLIIPGTGKIDRNGKINKKINVKLYRQLAELLSSMGFINLRYDKRGVAESEGDYNKTGLWDLVDDAKAGVQFLKGRPEVDPNKIILLGHSEGSMLATAVAAREELTGLILLAGAIENLNDVLIRQRDIASKDIMEAKGFQGFFLRLIGTQNKIEKQAQKFINKVLSSNDDVMKFNFVKINAKWLREHFAYNPKEDLAKVTCPVLAITGERDIQSNPEELKNLSLYVLGDSEYYVVENMGHSLKFQAKTSTIFSAKKDILAEAHLSVHPELVNHLEDWLQNYLGKNSSEEPVVV